MNNPFFVASTLYLQYPPFDRIENQHYRPPIERGMQEQLAEIEPIAGNPEPPSV